MIETIAIRIGTNASSDANTNASTTSAPSPPSIASTRTPGPLAAAGLVLERVEAGDVDRRTRDRVAGEHPRGGLRRLRVVAERLVVRRRVGEHERRAAVGGDERAVAGRRERRRPRPGIAARSFASTWSRPAAHRRRGHRRARRERHDRRGAARCCRRGGRSARSRSLVTNPSRPGTENFLLNDSVDDPTVAIPTIVTRIQNAATMRLCASTQRVIEVIIAATSTVRLRDA